MQNKTYHHGDLRNALILEAIVMLHEKGIGGLSLRELARRLGVGHNAPYRHFKNKQQLLEAVAATGFRRLKAHNLRLELELADDPESQLFESGVAILNMAMEQPELFRLMFGGYLSLANCGDELKEEAHASIESLVKIVSLGQQQDIFARGDVMRQTLAAMSMVQGLAMMASSGMLRENVTGDDQQFKRLALQVYDILLMGLKKR